jgi:hypothetical protein
MATKKKGPEKYSLRGRDVAHILDESPDNVLEQARRGYLKGKRVGRFWRFRASDVLAFKKEKGLRGG